MQEFTEVVTITKHLFCAILIIFFFCKFGIIDYVLNFSRWMNVLKSSRRKQLESYVHDTLLCFIEILH